MIPFSLWFPVFLQGKGKLHNMVLEGKVSLSPCWCPSAGGRCLEHWAGFLRCLPCAPFSCVQHREWDLSTPCPVLGTVEPPKPDSEPHTRLYSWWCDSEGVNFSATPVSAGNLALACLGSCGLNRGHRFSRPAQPLLPPWQTASNIPSCKPSFLTCNRNPRG